MRAEQLTAPVAWHGEGPLWDARVGRLLIVDMLAGAVVDLAEPEQPVRHVVGDVAAALRPRREGGFVIALEHGFGLFDDGFRLEAALPELVADAAIRFNDGGCDPQGRFYCGTMAYDESPGHGTLFRLDPDGTTAVVLDGVGISNGLQWGADGASVYYNDTLTGRIDVFDFDGATGFFGERREFARMPEGAGLPDGLAVDAEGGVWTALWGGGAVRRYDADGALSEIVEVPGLSNITACAFGGEGLRTLFITTSRQHLGEDEQPQAGAVFVVEPGVAGRALPSFAG